MIPCIQCPIIKLSGQKNVDGQDSNKGGNSAVGFRVGRAAAANDIQAAVRAGGKQKKELYMRGANIYNR